jgi:DNA-directed RNA polymerase subunit D
MEIILNRIDETSARFQIIDATPSFANALRRAMISEVPTLAIEDIRIYDNTSALFDEMLAHRIGLIPIRTEPGCYVPREQCSCNSEGCPGCTATLTMSVEGPRTVYSRDLIPQDPGAAPAYDNIPIVKLTKDQKLVVEARAFLSTGRQHAKWQATSACGYKNYPVIAIDERCDACGICVEDCPRSILEVAGKSVRVIEGRLEECSLCRLCEKACLNSGIGDEPAIRVTTEENRFLFRVESDGSMPAKEIIEQGLQHVRTRSGELEKMIEEISGGTSDERRSE